MAKLIPLTKGYFAICDNKDFKYLSQFKWSIDGSGYPQRMIKTDKGWRPIRMHRDLLKLKPSELADHRNGVKTDHRRRNIKKCSRLENNRNVGLRKNNKTGYKGVHFNKERNVYQSYINVNRKHIYLGAFNCQINAAEAYNTAAIRYHGEFANLNKV